MSEQRRLARQVISRSIYFLILVGVIVFLLQQGAEPWKLAAQHWKALIAVMIVSAAGYLVQAATFRECLPLAEQRPNLRTLLHIWATSGITSLLAPLMAGLAVRLVLLNHAGVGPVTSGLASLRQIWFNLECAFVLAGAVLLIFPFPLPDMSGWLLLATGVCAWGLRHLAAFRHRRGGLERIARVTVLAQPLRMAVLPWLWGQLLAMSCNYWVAFNFTGAIISFPEALLIAALTVALSVAIFVPNGLGLLDGLWVWLGSYHGLASPEAIALALILRFGNVAAAILLWLILTVLKKCSPPVG